MKAKNLNQIAASNPYAKMIAAGAHPDEIKELIVFILNKYISDTKYLRENATFLFSVQGVRIGRLVANPEWLPLLNAVFEVRQRVYREKPTLAVHVSQHFQAAIDESSRQYDLVARFEQKTQNMDMDEFAFEMLRNIGTLVESSLQPMLKEFSAILQIDQCGSANLDDIDNLSLGAVVKKIADCLPVPHLLAPRPHEIKVSQWRNIAQHHSYSIAHEKICMKYGGGRQQKEVELTRDELLSVAREIVSRISIFLGSRELSMVNYRALFDSTGDCKDFPISESATLIAAAIGTQGFELTSLSTADGCVHAEIRDLGDHTDKYRPVHCSQFVLVVGQCFLGSEVVIRFRGRAPGYWIFAIDATDLDYLFALENPYSQLINKIKMEFIEDEAGT